MELATRFQSSNERVDGSENGVINFSSYFLNSSMYDGLKRNPKGWNQGICDDGSLEEPSHHVNLPPEANAYKHPLESLHASYYKRKEEKHFDMLRHTYGVHAPFRMKMERQICSSARRLPGLKSSLCSLEVLMGQDTDIDVFDYLNTIKVEDDDVGPNCGVHELCEKTFNI